MVSVIPRVRAEFVNATTVGRVDRLRRYELLPPSVVGEIRGISEAAGCAHGPRTSVIVRVGGGHLRSSREELLNRVLEELPSRIGDIAPRAVSANDHIEQLVSWFENECKSGFLERAYVTVTILLAVSDDEVWTWLVSPHGVVHAIPGHATLVSTDLRYPVLRRLGLMRDAAFVFPG